MLRAAGHHQRDQRRKRQSQGYDLLFHGVLPGWGWEASSPGDAFFGAPQMVCGAADLCDSGQVPDSENRAAERVWRALPAQITWICDLGGTCIARPGLSAGRVAFRRCPDDGMNPSLWEEHGEIPRRGQRPVAGLAAELASCPHRI